MALTRRLLEGMGIEERQIETIIEAHADTVDGLKKDRDKYRDEAAKVPNLLKQLEDAKADTSLADLQAKYDELDGQLKALTTERDGLQSQFESYKAEVQGREDKRAKADAYRILLKEAGIADKYLDSILRVTDMSSIELEDGKVKDGEKVAESAKSQWSDFVVKQTTKGSEPDNPPSKVAGAGNGIDGANPRAVQIARERHERMYGKTSEE